MPTFTLKTVAGGQPVEEPFNDEAALADAVKTRWPSGKVIFGSGGIQVLLPDQNTGLVTTGETQNAIVSIVPAITINPSLWPLA
jgi:hypothetical protein